MTIINLKYSDIIKNQATINIGCIGHVSEGKSTVVRRLTGTATQRHKKEKERNITIKLGYANFKIWSKLDTGELFYTSSHEDDYRHPTTGEKLVLIKHLSFVDCPGHDSFMSTMLGGTSVMDCAFLLIASDNKIIPQVQTYEHLMAISNTDIDNLLILQNKLDLLNSKEEAYNNLDKIKDFIYGSPYENSTIIPISAQLGNNLDKICEYAYQNIDFTNKNINNDLYMPIIRSFDTNKPKQNYKKMTGGVIGGSILSGVLNIGDYIEIRPGIIRMENGNKICSPIITQVESIYSEKNSLKYAIPGGLIGIGTGMDPYFSGSNRLVGQIMGKVGTLPNIYSEIEVKIKRLRRFDMEKIKFSKRERVMICMNSNTIYGNIRVKGKIGNIILENPICCKISQKFAILKNIKGSFKLHSTGEVLDGKKFTNIKYGCNPGEYTNDEKKEYVIENDINLDNKKFSFDYETMLDNFDFKKKIKNTIMNYRSVIISRKARRIIVENMYEILSDLHDLHCPNFNYKNNFIKFFENEINKSCRFNGENHFIMSGKFKTAQIQNLIDKYVKKYVLCPICNSENTILVKENKLIKIKCNKCTSENSIF